MKKVWIVSMLLQCFVCIFKPLFQWYWSKWNSDFKIYKSSSWSEPKNQSGFKREVYRKYWNKKGEQRGKDGEDKQC